jgi:hypothetical protein
MNINNIYTTPELLKRTYFRSQNREIVTEIKDMPMKLVKM